MKTTGQILKENRERKGITLNEVALATKINVKILTAIEEGETERLPTKTFLRGFVRSYARYLDMDEEAILGSFYEEMGSTKPKLNVQSPEAPASAEGDRPLGAPPKAIDPSASGAGVKIGAIIGILALVALIVFFKKKMDSYQSESVIQNLPTEIEGVNRDGNGPISGDGTALPALTASPSPTPVDAVSASPSPSPSPSATPTPTAAPSPSPTSTPAATPTPSPSPQPTSTPRPSPSPSPSPSATPTPTPSPSPVATPTPRPSPSPSATPTPVAGKTQEVIIEALDNVEVEAKVDGEPARKIKLSADQVQTFKAKRKVSLRLSDGGAVNLIVNGTDRGVPGDLGKPSQVELP